MKKLLLCSGIVMIFSCSRQQPQVLILTGEKDPIPEGIAIEQNKIFLTSILKNKIIEYDVTNNKVTNFITRGQYGFKMGVGLFAKTGLLFALCNDSSTSSLFVFAIKGKKLLKTYQLKDSSVHLWNDLAIDDLNQVYITDTKQSKVFRISYPNDGIHEYFSDTSIAYPNGIALSGDNNKLFIASDQYGVRILDLPTKKILNEISTATAGIDGLKYYDGKLYAIKNGERNHDNHGLYCIDLTKKLDDIKDVKKILVGHPALNVPTTFALEGDYFYLLANSQMENLNQETMQIINDQALTDTYILKIKK